MSKTSDTPLTDDEKTAVDVVFCAFKRACGQALVDGGWDRATVSGGLEPAKAETWEQVPGVLWLVMHGFDLVKITKDYLEFAKKQERVMRLRGGGFLAEKARLDYLAQHQLEKNSER
ncbi:MAG: hypothetical protein HQL56_01075 [Magnetococcales bacterium]|nr:hypothetical protein [Magnetococcales bacterium]